MGKSGQDPTLGNMLNTIRLCKPGFTKSHMTLGNIVDLGNRIAYDFVKPNLQISYDLGSHDVTCQKLPRLAQLRHSQTFRKLGNPTQS